MKPASTKHKVFTSITRLGGTALGRPIATAVDSLNRAFQNDSPDHRTNGEEWIVRSMVGLNPRVVLDIGANVGTWSQMTLDLMPTTDVHSLEPIGTTFQELTSNLALSPRWHGYQLALTSPDESDLRMWTPGHSTVATAIEGFAQDLPSQEVPSTTGDHFCGENGISRIDFLKVDTEGYDLRVLKGFSNMLKQGAIDVIQFEFTLFAVFARVQLRDFYELLTPIGYKLGKLYPTWIDWRDYDAHDERYYRCNFVAVLEESPAATALISTRS